MDRGAFLDMLRDIKEPMEHLTTTCLPCLQVVTFDVGSSKSLVSWWIAQLESILASDGLRGIRIDVPERVQ